MPLSDRDYVRGSHPPACTCVRCAVRGLVYRPGRFARRGYNAAPRRVTYKRTRRKMARLASRFARVSAFAISVLIVWIGMGVLDDYRRTGEFNGRSALNATLERVRALPDDVGRATRETLDFAGRLIEIESTGSPRDEDLIGKVLEFQEPGQTAQGPNDHKVRSNSPLEINAEDAKFEISPAQSTAGINVGELESLIHQFVNEERRRNGLKPLVSDDKLIAIARNHSSDMAVYNYFSHVNLAGEEPTDRGARQGYRCRKDFGSFYTEGIPENIFQNWLYSSITYFGLIPVKNWSSANEIAVATVKGWMNSPGHRANILNNTYELEGIGVAIATNDKVYITQNFC